MSNSIKLIPMNKIKLPRRLVYVQCQLSCCLKTAKKLVNLLGPIPQNYKELFSKQPLSKAQGKKDRFASVAVWGRLEDRRGPVYNSKLFHQISH